jgi:hypothetical protein
MIKKLRNQPYASKVGASSQMGAKEEEKKLSDTVLRSFIICRPVLYQMLFSE